MTYKQALRRQALLATIWSAALAAGAQAQVPGHPRKAPGDSTARPDAARMDTLKPAQLAGVVIRSVRPHRHSSTQTIIQSGELGGEKNASDVPLALVRQANITAQSDAGSGFGYAYFRIRGLESTRMTITLDGMPLAEPEDQGVYFSNLPAFISATGTMTMTAGTAPGASGLTSYAGALDFTTRPALAKKASASLLAGAFGTRKAAISATSGTIGRFGVGADATAQTSKGFRQGAFNKGEGGAVTATWMSENTSAKIQMQSGHVRNGMAYLAASETDLARNRRFNPLGPEETDNFSDNLVVATATHRLQKDPGTILEAGLLAHWVKGWYDVNLGELSRFGVDGNTTTLRLSAAKEKGSFRLNAGAIGVSSGRRHTMAATNEPGSLFYDNKGTRQIGSLVSGVSWSRNDLTAGADIEAKKSYFHYNPGRVAQARARNYSYTFFNPHLWASARLGKSLTARASAGTASREPTRSDLFGGFDNLDAEAERFIDNNDVKPERVRDFEAGVEWNRGKAEIGVTAYHLRFHDEIAPLGRLSYIGLPLRKNVRSSQRSGLEVHGKLEGGAGGLEATAAIQRARIQSFTDDQLDAEFRDTPPLLSPPVRAQLAGYIAVGKNGRVSATQSYQASSFLTNTGDRRFMLKRAATTDLDARIQKGQIGMSVSVKNLWNSRYETGGYTDYSQSYYYPGAGRAVALNIIWGI